MTTDPVSLLRQAADKLEDQYDRAAMRRIERGISLTETGCWSWQRATNSGGYAVMKYRGRQTYAHRLSYMLVRGPIGTGLQVDHLCRNTRCVNPTHLDVVTAQVNTLRSDAPAAANSKKTNCPKGHPYDLVNTYLEPSGKRSCKICRRERNRVFMRGYRKPAIDLARAILREAIQRGEEEAQ